MSRSLIIASVLAALSASAVACERNPKSQTTTTAAEKPTTTLSGTLPPGDRPHPEVAAPVQPLLTVKDVGLSTPESVLHDADADVYLVSNIDGKPLEADGKGFISRIKPDGAVENLKWIEAGKNKVTLNAPKGLAIMGQNLYVADLDTVRLFDRKTGAPAGEVKVPGATFLNGITVAGNHVIVSDTGMKAAAGGAFEPSGTDAVYAIDKDKKLTTIAKSKDLANPNGVLGTQDQTWVVSFGSNELYSLDAKGKKADVTHLPKGQLDGIVPLGGTMNEVLVSSWESSTVYRGRPGGTFKPVAENVKSPAAIGYDLERHRLLVPLFDTNEIRVFEVH